MSYLSAQYHVLDTEQFGKHNAVGGAPDSEADSVSLVIESLHHLEPARPTSLEAVPHLDGDRCPWLAILTMASAAEDAVMIGAE